MLHDNVRLWRSASLASLTTLCVCLGSACSLVNSFDEVVVGGAGSSAGNAGAGGSGASDAGVGGSAGEGLGGGGTGGDMPDASSFEEAGPLLVVAGLRREPSNILRRVLMVLDADDGQVLDSEQLPVSGVVHDGATDLWYLFLAEEFPAPRNAPVELQARAWENGAWTTVASVRGVPPPQPETFAVLNGRLAYASWKIGPGNTAVQAVTILDTSEPSAIVELPVPADVITPADLDNPIIDLIGTPGRVADGSALGGDLVLLMRSACDSNDVCTLGAQPVSVGTSITRGVARALGTFKGRPAINQAHSRDIILVAAPSAIASSVVLAQFNARTLLPQGTAVNSSSTTQNVSGVAYGECLSAALFAEGGPPQTNGSLFGVSMLNSLATREPLGRAGEGIYYEPFTRTLVAPYRGQAVVADAGADAGEDGGIDPGSGPSPAQLVAYRVGVSGASIALQLLSERDWASPVGLSAYTLAARVPRRFSCPQ